MARGFTHTSALSTSWTISSSPERTFCRFADAGSCPFQLVSSDHRAVGCRMRFEASLQRKVVVPRNERLRLDCSSLYDKTGQQAFAREVIMRVNSASIVTMPARAALEVSKDGWVTLTVTATAAPGHTKIDPARPSLSEACNGDNDDDPTLFASFTTMHGAHWWYDDHLYQRYRAAIIPPATPDPTSLSSSDSPSPSSPP
eukprot:554117-Prymnesium_polylepis.1